MWLSFLIGFVAIYEVALLINECYLLYKYKGLRNKKTFKLMIYSHLFPFLARPAVTTKDNDERREILSNHNKEMEWLSDHYLGWNTNHVLFAPSTPDLFHAKKHYRKLLYKEDRTEDFRLLSRRSLQEIAQQPNLSNLTYFIVPDFMKLILRFIDENNPVASDNSEELRKKIDNQGKILNGKNQTLPYFYYIFPILFLLDKRYRARFSVPPIESVFNVKEPMATSMSGGASLLTPQNLQQMFLLHAEPILKETPFNINSFMTSEHIGFVALARRVGLVTIFTTIDSKNPSKDIFGSGLRACPGEKLIRQFYKILQEELEENYRVVGDISHKDIHYGYNLGKYVKNSETLLSKLRLVPK